MLRWDEFARIRPDLAESGYSLLHQFGPGLAFLGTVRKDGGPRMHPVCPVVYEGALYVFVIGLSPERYDLIRDPRYALHSFPPAENDNEFYCTGATTPLFSVLLTHWLTSEERMTPARVLGVVAGLVGVTIMIGGDAFWSLGISVIAQMAILAAAIAYAFAGIFGRRFAALGVSPFATATGQVTASSIMLMPVVLLVDKPWMLSAPNIVTVGALIGLAGLSTAFVYILYFRTLSSVGATNLLLVTFPCPGQRRCARGAGVKRDPVAKSNARYGRYWIWARCYRRPGVGFHQERVRSPSFRIKP